MKLNKFINVVYASTFLLLVETQHALAAADIKAPSWVRKADKSNVSAAGEEINMWIYAFMVVVIALFAIKPAYYFVVGKTEEAMAASQNILIGAVVSMVLGGIVFAVMAKFG